MQFFVSKSILAWTAITKYHRAGDLNNRYMFLTVLKARNSKIKVLADWLLERILFLSCRWLPPLCVSTWQREREGAREWGRASTLLSLLFIRHSLNYCGLPWCLSGKESACDAGDRSSIPRSGRSPGEGNGNSLQYFCLENPMDGGAWWASP